MLKLTVQDRIILTNVLNTEGTIAEVSLSLDIYNKIKFSDEDQKHLSEKGKEPGFDMENVNIAPLCADFSDSERQRILNAFEKLGGNGKMNMMILPLYRKIKG